MKSSTALLASTAALCALLAGSVHAEQYQGVLRFQSTESRAQVRAQAVVAAHTPDPYREGANADLPSALPHEADRAQVRAQADEAARAGNLYSDVAGDGVTPLPNSSIDRQAVRQQAITAAARGISDGVE